MTKIEFFNNKELWSNWYVDNSISKKERKEYRHLMNIHILEASWRCYLRVTIEKKYLPKNFYGGRILIETEEHITIFSDFRQTYLPKKLANIEENYNIVINPLGSNKYIKIPIKAIMNFYSAGWPRHGYHKDCYLVEPIEILKPISNYLNGHIDVNKLIMESTNKKLYYRQEALNVIYNEIYSLIEQYDKSNELIWRKKLVNLYKIVLLVNENDYLNMQTKNPYYGIKF